MNIINSTICGYTINEFINKWWFGSVYKAIKNDKIFAIKIFHEENVLREFRIHWTDNRLIREIDIMKSLNHENLVAYVDHFTEQIEWNQVFFLVMEYVSWQSLRQLISSQTVLDINLSINLFIQIATALNYLHTYRWQGSDFWVIHRDLKPENVLITDEWKVKICDFGIAKVIDFTSLTNTWEVFWTWPYMSPEQITDSKNIDKRSDYYSLWVILYEMLTWVFPFDFQFIPELIEKIKTEPPVFPKRRRKEIDNHIENVILKLLEKDPYLRYNAINDILYDLTQKKIGEIPKEYDLTPRFILRLDNDKNLISEYARHNSKFWRVEFPANFIDEKQRKWMLDVIKESNLNMICDPATTRLAYDKFRKTIWVKNLPYAPELPNVISPEYFTSFAMIKSYVKSVVDIQASIWANIIVAPSHYLPNTSTLATTGSPFEEWLELDLKLLRETLEYRNSEIKLRDIPVYAGIYISNSVLSNSRITNYLLNQYTLLNCDWFIVAVDWIDYNTTAWNLLNYLRFMRNLSISTWKPTIAERVWVIWIWLICLWITWFSSWPSERDKFYEDLLSKNDDDVRKTWIKYYHQDILTCFSFSISKQTPQPPTKFRLITAHTWTCWCYYCYKKEEVQILKSANVKFHYLENIYNEIEIINQIPINQRLNYFKDRINNSIEIAERVPTLSKDYAHLYVRKEVFETFID
jgi:serine/threonine protein kinase